MSKKTENIEIRVSPELKEAVSRLSKARGQSMSEAIRDLLAREVAAPSSPRRGAFAMPKLAQPIPLKATLAAMSVGVLALGYSLSAQLPAAASSQAEIRVLFAEFDRNGDDQVTAEEFAAFIAIEIAEERAEIGEDAAFPLACAGTFIEEEHLEEASETRDADEEFAALDSNANQRLEFDEIQAMIMAERARDFIEFDHDGNGFVTLDEVTETLAPPTPEDLRAGLNEEGLPGPCIDAIIAEETAETDEDPVEEARLLLAEHDVNRDGRIALLEFLQR